MSQLKPLTRLRNVFKQLSSSIWNKRRQIKEKIVRNKHAESNFPFDEAYYLAQNPDVKASGMRALDHYHLYGRLEARKTYESVNNRRDNNPSHSLLKL
jgi:hypothetical protein